MTMSRGFVQHASPESGFSEMGELRLDESCISNPKSEISHWTDTRAAQAVQFDISDFGFEVDDDASSMLPPSLRNAPASIRNVGDLHAAVGAVQEGGGIAELG